MVALLLIQTKSKLVNQRLQMKALLSGGLGGQTKETHSYIRGYEAHTKPSQAVDINITESAASRIRSAAATEGIAIEDSFLRIGVVSGGCSGLSYDLGWDTVLQDDDEVAEIAGLRVVLDLNSYLYLEGSTLDFTDGLEGKGFHFNNPQASRTCACGESFSV